MITKAVVGWKSIQLGCRRLGFDLGSHRPKLLQQVVKFDDKIPATFVCVPPVYGDTMNIDVQCHR